MEIPLQQEYEKSSKFRYLDITDKYIDIVCKVRKYKSTNSDNWNIDFSVEYIYQGSNENKLKMLKRLDLMTEDNEEYSGDILHSNPMIDQMIQYLMMNNDDLIKYTGLTTPDRYKLQIINSLKLFWD